MTKRDIDRWGSSPLDAPLDPQTDAALDAMFAQARELARDRAPAASSDLMARIMADADAQIAAMAPLRPSPAKTQHPLMRAAMAALGGWRGLTGVATAGVTGLVIGLGAPTMVTDFALGSSSVALTDTVAEVSSYAFDDLVPSFYDLGTEG
ncbi:hypothetical protein [Celeribacter sp.]|uniref:hypothetical protein n=1 Tax=Celeribacter sp. TaxID=1890673 RepID=UPI003A94342A